MESFIAEASQYGAIGLTLLASFWYINKKDNDIKIERTEMHTSWEKMHENILITINNNTTALVGLSSIIKNK